MPTEINSAAPVAIDAMGGDGGVPVAVAGVLRCLRQQQGLKVLLIGKEPLLKAEIDRRIPAPLHSRIELQHAPKTVAEEERPAAVLRREQREEIRATSMGAAIEAVRDGRACACVSAGNSGALMGLGLSCLGVWPGVERPAICCRLPAKTGHSLLLDVGANVDTSPRRLLQFARLGALLAAADSPGRKPKVALLGIGTEPDKGNRQVREAAQLLSAAKDLNYIGLIESSELFSACSDVIVCDGFVGNIALKAAESAADRVLYHLQRELEKYPLRRLLLGMLGIRGSDLARGVEPGQHNGACFLGLKGVVVKSHGGAEETAFAAAIEYACRQVSSGAFHSLSRYFAKETQEDSSDLSAADLC